MKRFSAIWIIVLTLFVTSAVFASGVALTGIGARATAMAGAYRGVANDWSAMFWHPAGITNIEGLHAGLSFESIKPVASYKAKIDGAPLQTYYADERNNYDKTFYIPAAGVVYGMGRLSFGLSVYAPFGLGAEWDIINSDIYSPAYPEVDYEDDLKVIAINPTIGIKLTDKLSLGVGFNYTIADIIIRQPSTAPNPLLSSTDISTQLIVNNILKPLGLTADLYQTLLVDQTLEGEGTGYGFTFGLQYNLTENLTLGLSGNWYKDVPLDGIINAKAYLPKIDDATLQTLAAQLNSVSLMTDEQRQQILGAYSGATVDAYTDMGGDTDLPLPMTLGGGIAYTGIENLLLALDVSWTQWSSWDVIEIKIEDGEISKLVENWEDGIRVSAGFEYQLSEAMKLRGGYYTEPSAVPSHTLTITIPDISRRHGINIGLSYDLGLFDFYASYERILLGDREVTEWMEENLAGSYGMKVNNFMAGLGIQF